MTGAQIAFSAALGAVSLSIAAFALYVVCSTMWADRWYRRRRP